MEQKQITDLITKLEDYSSAHPQGYRLRVTLLATLGYAYLAAVVIALLATVYITFVYVGFSGVTIKLVWIPLVLVGLILRSLWITIPIPDGHPLNEADAEPLFTLIKDLQKDLNGPTVHRVLLSDEFNAGIVQIPRFGMFGWLKNYLVVGLPLLTALKPDELRAVLTHEFGHLSGKHGRFSGWIYRIRESWVQILTAVHRERSYAAFLFEPFLNWYAPFFSAYSFVLARMQEYEADALASQTAGKLTAARALVDISLTQRGISDEFWPSFYRGAVEQKQPPKDPFGQLVEHLGEKDLRETADKWLLQELKVKTGYDDTHPALADRLIAMGFEADSLAEKSTLDELVGHSSENSSSAATHYLTSVPDEFLSRSNRLWREQILSTWRQRHTEIENARNRLAELDKQAEMNPLSIEERWERIGHISEIDGPATALNSVRELLAIAPEHAMGNFFLGSMLLEQKNEEGLRYLELAIKHESSINGLVFSVISNFYLLQGDLKQAEEYRVRAEQAYETAEDLQKKAMTISPTDRFETHGLTAAELQKLQEQLKQIRGLARAVLVRKVLDQPADPIYVMGVVADYTWHEGRNDKHIDQLLGELVNSIRFEHPTVFVSLDVQQYLIPCLTNVSGSTVFAHDGVVEAELEVRH